MDTKKCEFCGTVNDAHHSAECLDTDGKGYAPAKAPTGSRSGLTAGSSPQGQIEAMVMCDMSCTNCGDGPRDEKIKELRHALHCAEISLNGYRDYLHDMAIVELDGKIYRGVPGKKFRGKWEMLHRHKAGNTWVQVKNYQIKSDLNKYAGSTGEDETE